MLSEFPKLEQLTELLDSKAFSDRVGQVMAITDAGNEASLEIAFSPSKSGLWTGEVYDGTSNMAPTLYTPQGYVRVCDFHSHPESKKPGFLSPSPSDLRPNELSYVGFWSEDAAKYFRQNDVRFRQRNYLQKKFSNLDFSPVAVHLVPEEGFHVVKPTREQVEEYLKLEEQFGVESPFFGIFGRVGENARLLLYHFPENKEYSGLVNLFDRKYFEPSSEPREDSFRSQEEVVEALKRNCDAVLVKDYKI